MVAASGNKCCMIAGRCVSHTYKAMSQCIKIVGTNAHCTRWTIAVVGAKHDQASIYQFMFEIVYFQYAYAVAAFDDFLIWFVLCQSLFALHLIYTPIWTLHSLILWVLRLFPRYCAEQELRLAHMLCAYLCCRLYAPRSENTTRSWGCG